MADVVSGVFVKFGLPHVWVVAFVSTSIRQGVQAETLRSKRSARMLFGDLDDSRRANLFEAYSPFRLYMRCAELRSRVTIHTGVCDEATD
jgi:hypothetical protein